MRGKSYWQRYIKPYSVTLTSGMIFMYVEHGFPIVNHAPFLPTGKPGSKQTPTAAGSKKKPAAACRTQQAESSKQKTQKTAAAAAAAAATGRRIQQEEERYCRSTSSQPERSVWHLQVWNYGKVQRHIWDVKTMQLRENRQWLQVTRFLRCVFHHLNASWCDFPALTSPANSGSTTELVRLRGLRVSPILVPCPFSISLKQNMVHQSPRYKYSGKSISPDPSLSSSRKASTNSCWEWFMVMGKILEAYQTPFLGL